MDLFGTGMKFATAIAEVKVGIADVRIFSALFCGDMEGARKAAEELPFGLGQIVKELSGPVDSAVRKLTFALRGLTEESPGAGGGQRRRDQAEGVAEWNRYVDAYKKAREALAQVGETPQETAIRGVMELNLTLEHTMELAGLIRDRFAEIAVKRDQDRVAALLGQGERAVFDAEDRLARATLGTQDYLRWQGNRLPMGQDAATRVTTMDVITAQIQEDAQFVTDAFSELDAAAAKTTEEVKRLANGADSLTASLQTPRERLKADLDQIRAYGNLIGDPTRQRAELQALLKAQAAGVDLAALGYKDFGLAGKGMKAAEAATGTASTFYKWDAAGMAVGRGEALLSATQEVAKNTTGLITAIEKTVLRFG